MHGGASGVLMTAGRKRALETVGTTGDEQPPMQMRLELKRSVRAPAIARAAISEQLEEFGVDGSYGQTVVLLVSEVVSNAVRHSSGPEEAPIAFAASIGPNGVRVAVTDAGVGFTPRRRDPAQLSDGYGLYLLEKAATSWGVEDIDGTTVWFELALAPRSS
jgi:serine/threonine-protein kinase RsbW